VCYPQNIQKIRLRRIAEVRSQIAEVIRTALKAEVAVASPRGQNLVPLARWFGNRLDRFSKS